MQIKPKRAQRAQAPKAVAKLLPHSVTTTNYGDKTVQCSAVHYYYCIVGGPNGGGGICKGTPLQWQLRDGSGGTAL